MGIFLKIDTRGNLPQKQAAITWFDKKTDLIIYGGAKGGGKSYLGAMLMCCNAICYPETYYFIARKTLNDLRRFTRPTIELVLKNWNMYLDIHYSYNGQDNFYTFKNGSRIYLLDAKFWPSDPKYTRFGSRAFTQGWIEETGEIPESAYESLRITVGRWKNEDYGLLPKLLLTCNPAKNFLIDFYTAFKEGKLNDKTAFIVALPTDNKVLGQNYYDLLARTLKGSAKERLLFGNWEYDDNPYLLYDYENILDIFENDHATQRDNKWYIAADIATYGNDHFVVSVFNDFELVELLLIEKSGDVLIVETIKNMQKKYNIPQKQIIIDGDGVGSSYVGATSSFKFAIKFNANRRPKNYKKFKNLKTEAAFFLKEKIDNHSFYVSAKISEEVKKRIIRELEVIKVVESKEDGQKLELVSKSEMKKTLGGASPDIFDSFIMRMSVEITTTIEYSLPY